LGGQFDWINALALPAGDHYVNVPATGRWRQVMQVLSTTEGENFTHRLLWCVVARQIENAEARRNGALYDHIAAMVFALHSFEAYLNFLGVRLAPDIWTDERNFFRKEPYRGFEGKVRKVFELCRLSEPDRLARPCSTVWALKALRDEIVHGQIQTFSQTYSHNVGEEPPLFQGRFDNLVSCDKALEAKQDIHAVACMLHIAARPHVTDVWLGDDPFCGPHGHATGTSQLQP
jgi:hypothetical protein